MPTLLTQWNVHLLVRLAPEAFNPQARRLPSQVGDGNREGNDEQVGVLRHHEPTPTHLPA